MAFMQNTDIPGGKRNHDGYVSVVRQLTERFDFPMADITLRSSQSADDNEWAAMPYADGEAKFLRSYPIHIVDRFGGGRVDLFFADGERQSAGA